MEQELMVKIPRNWMKGLPDEELTLKQIIRLGIHQYRMERALQLLRDDVGSRDMWRSRRGWTSKILSKQPGSVA